MLSSVENTNNGHIGLSKRWNLSSKSPLKLFLLCVCVFSMLLFEINVKRWNLVVSICHNSPEWLQGTNERTNERNDHWCGYDLNKRAACLPATLCLFRFLCVSRRTTSRFTFHYFFCLLSFFWFPHLLWIFPRIPYGVFYYNIFVFRMYGFKDLPRPVCEGHLKL